MYEAFPRRCQYSVARVGRFAKERCYVGGEHGVDEAKLSEACPQSLPGGPGGPPEGIAFLERTHVCRSTSGRGMFRMLC